MLSFLTAKNIVDKELVEAFPWDFSPAPDALKEMRSKKKDVRRVVMITPGTNWQIYTTVVGEIRNARVHAKDNPPRALRGLSIDYDAQLNLEAVVSLINQLPEDFQPQFLELTLGKKNRLVWVFESEVLVAGYDPCAAMMEAFVERMGLKTLLPGYDDASTKPTEVWTNGGEWYELKKTPVSHNIVRGIAIDQAKNKDSSMREEIPFALIAAEIEKRWPGRWQGDFEVGKVGVRFWDAAADCPTGCQVKSSGMLCFTGKVPFVWWKDLFGVDWVDQQRALNIGRAGADLHYDGKIYWEKAGERWYPRSRQDTVLLLKGRGLSDKAPKGVVMSDAERTLLHIQGPAGWVDGAAPFVNYRPGVIDINGKRMLNISTFKPLQPAATVGTPEEDFPFIWKFLNGHFARPELRPLEHFLGWLQRFYSSLVNYEPGKMGQAIFLCGPAGNGKSLLCIRIVGGLCGGRMSAPIEYFYGDEQFNSEIFETPLIALNDQDAPKTEGARNKYAAKMKSFVVNPSHTYHPKFCNKVSVDWTGRIFFTLNDDAGSVGVLSEVNSNTHDKMSFFASQPFVGEWPVNTDATVANELPKFARWLLDVYKLPADLRCGDVRVGVKSFYDPVILDLSQQQVVAFNLLELLKVWVSISEDIKKDGWAGTPSELVARLSASNELAILLKDWNVFKVAKSLTTLARLEGSGVTSGDGQRMFKIDPALISK